MRCSLLILQRFQLQPNSAAMKNFMRALSVGIVPFTTGLPSGVFMYWVASNGFSLGQTLQRAPAKGEERRRPPNQPA